MKIVTQKAALASTKWRGKKQTTKQTKKTNNRFILTDIRTNQHHTSRRLQYFGSDSYYPALGCRQETSSYFALTDIHTNQHRTNR